MSTDRSWMKWALALPLALALAQVGNCAAVENPPVTSVCGLSAGVLASTCDFTTPNANGTGVPISARTDFIEDWDSQGYDGLTLATHELFHAIGFTVNYADFASKLYATPGAGANGIPANSRVYSTNGTVGGILMVITPTPMGDEDNLGTHADPNATGMAPWPATGYNQANDIMQPFLPKATARNLSGTDFAILADAFGWNRTGIKFVIDSVGGTMDDTDMNIIANAAAAITAQYGTFETSPTFTWDVAEAVPEPATWMITLLSFGLCSLVVIRQRPVRAQH